MNQTVAANTYCNYIYIYHTLTSPNTSLTYCHCIEVQYAAVCHNLNSPNTSCTYIFIIPAYNLLFSLPHYWLAGPFPHVDELGVSQTSRGKSQPIILIVNISVCVFQMNMNVSVTEFSEVLPPFFPPSTFSSVRVGGVVVVVVVGGWGGTVKGT